MASFEVRAKTYVGGATHGEGRGPLPCKTTSCRHGSGAARVPPQVLAPDQRTFRPPRLVTQYRSIESRPWP